MRHYQIWVLPFDDSYEATRTHLWRARETSRESSFLALYTGCKEEPCQGANAAFATKSQKPVSAWELVDLARTGDKSILQLHHGSSYNEIMVQGVKPR
jgi:hypothetical protein